MSNKPTLNKVADTEARSNLIRQANRLGMVIREEWSDEELTKRLALRREQIESLDWGGLMDIMTWAKHPVPTRPTKLAVAQIILAHKRGHYQGLSHKGLVCLAILRNVKIKNKDSARKIMSRLRRSEGIWGYVLRKRDKLVGSVLSTLVDAEPQINGTANQSETLTLQEHIEQRGLIEGLGSGLRGAADGYISEKMQEIEDRIDYKLDEIDRRLAEWRNRELTNRLRMIKITLAVSVVIALLSLLYTYIREQL
ncbi:MAG: hypothetical protein GWP14_07490 [Actinobacteria bacterium]|nr:hypothetical protein [Actinomycetota bacterium]